MCLLFIPSAAEILTFQQSSPWNQLAQARTGPDHKRPNLLCKFPREQIASSKTVDVPGYETSLAGFLTVTQILEIDYAMPADGKWSVQVKR